MENILNNKNNKGKFILLENIKRKMRKELKNDDKNLEKLKELKIISLNLNKELDKIAEEEKLAERKELIEKHINENMQYAKENEEKVEECSLKQWEPDPRKEVKIIKISIKTAQVNEMEFSEERVEFLELEKPQGNIAVVSKFMEIYENVKVNKNIQVLSHEERESCNKEIKVERNIIVEDIGNREDIYIDTRKGRGYEKIGRKFQ